jgi:3-hydroxyacyl-[acyl-carrier-protein] dehydratase
LSEDFAHSIITLKEAKNVKYADFVPPGQTLTVTVSLLKKDERFATLKVEGAMGERTTLSGRLVLERYNLADHDPQQQTIDDQLTQYFRRVRNVLLDARLASVAG